MLGSITIGKVIASVGTTIITKLLTEKVIITIFIKLMEWLVTKTKNELDDSLVQEIKEALEFK